MVADPHVRAEAEARQVAAGQERAKQADRDKRGRMKAKTAMTSLAENYAKLAQKMAATVVGGSRSTSRRVAGRHSEFHVV